MEKLLLTLVALVLVSSCSGQATSCSDYPCPKYDVIKKYESFEERRYVATDWISTKLSNKDGASLVAAAKTLRAFCDKQKEAGNQITDGWPALVTIAEGDAPSMSVSWFLASDSKPVVTDTSVTPEHKAGISVYVRSFSRTPTLALAEENRKILIEALDKEGKKYNPDIFTGAFYNSYISLTYYNEVWVYSA